MRKKISVLIGLCLCFSMLAIGCKQAAKKPVPNNPDANIQKNDQIEMTGSEKRILADQISKVVTNINGVKKATVVISAVDDSALNNLTSNDKLVALVGVNLNDNIAGDNQQINAIKQKIKSDVMAQHTRVSNVLITTDAAMIKKINEVASGLLEGKAVQSYNNDVKQIQNQLQAK